MNRSRPARSRNRIPVVQPPGREPDGFARQVAVIIVGTVGAALVIAVGTWVAYIFQLGFRAWVLAWLGFT